jgi:hypothetical protein
MDQQGQLADTPERIQFAVEAVKQGQFRSLRKAASTYNVAHQRVSDRLHGAQPRRVTQTKRLKFTVAEETALKQWILSMDNRGMAPTIEYTRRMADLLLANRPASQAGQVASVGQHWVRRFVDRHADTIKARYFRRYDYRRAQYKDPVLL